MHISEPFQMPLRSGIVRYRKRGIIRRREYFAIYGSSIVNLNSSLGGNFAQNGIRDSEKKTYMMYTQRMTLTNELFITLYI